MKNAVTHIIFWSIISAAFIGPGTVTTALTAGSGFQYQLLWALVFSLAACFVIQEASARMTIKSGLSLGEAIRAYFTGKLGKLIRAVVGLAVVFGCTAYQAGNLTGAMVGIQLIHPLPKVLILSLFAGLITLLLLLENLKLVTRIMGGLVGIMSIVFIFIALGKPLPVTAILDGLIPAFPENSGLLVLSLVGTTIVPYNIFLGSGISRGQTVPSMRTGLAGSIAIGGIISVSIMLVGANLAGSQSFQQYHTSLANIHPLISTLFASGLFAAGFTSSITAPLASVVTIRTLFGSKPTNKGFKWVSILVVVIGFIFALSGAQPVQTIIAAQAFNGFLLPFIAVILFMMIHSGSTGRTGLLPSPGTVVMFLVTMLITFLGVHQLISAVLRYTESELSLQVRIWLDISIMVLLLGFVLAGMLRKKSDT